MKNLQCISEVRTHVGNVRSHNEDAAAVRDADGLWIVADGMGGHQAGDYASSKIVTTVGNMNLRAYLIDVVEQVEDALLAVNSELISYASQSFSGNSKVGSTVVCLIVRDGVAVTMWSGDSRAYLLRNNKLFAVTKDHTKVQELMDQGHMSAQQAEQSNFKNMLTRAVGVHDELFVDLNALAVKKGDRFLLCSDGLYNEVEEDDIQRMMQKGSLKKVANNLLDSALANSARDNITLILVDVK